MTIAEKILEACTEHVSPYIDFKEEECNIVNFEYEGLIINYTVYYDVISPILEEDPYEYKIKYIDMEDIIIDNTKLNI